MKTTLGLGKISLLVLTTVIALPQQRSLWVDFARAAGLSNNGR